MLKSPFITNSRNAKNPLQEAVFSLHDITKIKIDLENLKAKHEAEHKAKMAEIDAKLAETHQHITSIKKGDPGKNGISPIVDENAIADRVQSRIRIPKDGKTPIIDHELIAKKAAKLITLPKAKDGLDATPLDPMDIIALIKEKKLLKPEHIDGLTEEISSYRNQLAGKHYGDTTMVRGGGDTIAAGSNVTITRLANGQVQINATGASLTTLTATETPDGSTAVFTFAMATAKPSFLIIDYAQKPDVAKNGNVNWTWNAGTKQATLNTVSNQCPPPNEDIYAIT